jgi:hypothetical protein
LCTLYCILQAWAQKLTLGDFPSQENVPIPASNPKKKLSPAAYAAEKAHRKAIAEAAAAGDEQVRYYTVVHVNIYSSV